MGSTMSLVMTFEQTVATSPFWSIIIFNLKPELFDFLFHVSLNVLNQIDDWFQISLLIGKHLLDILNPVSVLFVIVLESIDQISVLKGYQRLLEYFEIEKLMLLQVIVNYLVRHSF